MKKLLFSCFFFLSAGLSQATELVQMIQTYQADWGALSRLYTNQLSLEYFDRMQKFNQDYLKTLQAQTYESLSEDGKIDYVLFRNYLEKTLAELDIDRRGFEEITSVLAFAHIS